MAGLGQAGKGDPGEAVLCLSWELCLMAQSTRGRGKTASADLWAPVLDSAEDKSH